MKNLDPYIGGRFIDEIHDGTFDKFRKDREAEGVSIGSVDRDVGTAARVLEEAARKWRDDGTNLTWLVETPVIEYQREYNKRLPTPSTGRSRRPKGFQPVRAHDLRHTRTGGACEPLV